MTRSLAQALVLLLLGTLVGCGVVPGGDREIKVVFAETAGLYEGNDVGVLGVPVGRITEIEPQGSVVEVTLEVTRDDIKIPANAAAVVVSRSAATDRYVELTPVFRGGAEMKSGATIPLERTRTPVDFDNVLHSMSDLAEGLTSNPRATNGLREVLRVTAAAFSGNGPELRRAVTGLADLVDTVHGQRGNIFASMESLDRLAFGLAKNDRLVRSFVRNLGAALQLLNSERHTIGAVVKRLSSTVERVAGFSRQHRGKVKATLVEVQGLLRTILASRRDLGETIETLPLATENIANTAGRDGNVWVRVDPGQLTPLGPLFEQLCRVLGPVCNLITFPGGRR